MSFGFFFIDFGMIGVPAGMMLLEVVNPGAGSDRRSGGTSVGSFLMKCQVYEPLLECF